MIKAKVKFSNILLFLTALFTLLISGTTVYSIEQFERLRDITLLGLFGVLVLLFLLNLKGTRIFPKGYAQFCIGAGIFFMGSFLAHPNSSSINFFSKVLMVILFTYVFSKEKYAKQLFKYLYEMIVCVAVIALIFFVVLYILRIPLPYTTLSNGFYNSYFYLFYNTNIYQETIGLFVYYRLQGIFWEPGVFGIYLILGLYYYTFIDEKKEKKKLYILVACLLLTTSTTGIILGIFIIAVLLLRKIKKNSTRILIIIPLGILTAAAVYYIWMTKKSGGAGYSASYTLRMVDLQSSLKVWKNHLLFGTGYGNTDEFTVATGIWNREGSSNGLMGWCMTIGLWGLFAQLLPLVSNILRSKKSQKMAHVVFAIIYIGINMTEPLTTSPLMLMLLSFEYVYMAMKYGRKPTNELKGEEVSIGLS